MYELLSTFNPGLVTPWSVSVLGVIFWDGIPEDMLRELQSFCLETKVTASELQDSTRRDDLVVVGLRTSIDYRLDAEEVE